MKIVKVGVLGAGLMGSGIAEVAAKAGYSTMVREVDEELVRKGMGRIETSLAKAVEKGKLAPASRRRPIGSSIDCASPRRSSARTRLP